MIKLNYTTANYQNTKQQKTMQNVPDSLDRRGTRDAAKKQS